MEYDDFYRYIDEQIDSYVPLKKVLQQEEITFASAFDMLEKFTERFSQLLSEYNINSRNIVTLCYDLIKRIKETPDNSDLIYMYFCIVTDNGLLNDINSDDWVKSQKVHNYIGQKKTIQNLTDFYDSQYDSYKKFLSLRDYLKKAVISEHEDSGEELDQLYELTSQYKFLVGSSEKEIFHDNLKALLSQLNGNVRLRPAKPYILFAVLSRKHGMIKKRECFMPNIRTVFQYQSYNIYHDNGKNFNYYQWYIELYENLRIFYSEDSDIDMPFCDFCFANLCPLNEWYYEYCRPDFDIPISLKMKVRDLKSLSFPMIMRYGDYADCDIVGFEEKHSKIFKLWDKAIDYDIVEKLLDALYNGSDISEIISTLPYSEKYSKYAEVFMFQNAEIFLEEKVIESAELFFKI
ncbi:MAG: hypothetical protein NC177_10295 [Ruminococcus flavefaciens]|nr:hypothetical protein [Ruminococcus flavefaciens]